MTTTHPEAPAAPSLSDIAGRRIRGLRNELGLSQRKLALIVGIVSPSGLSDRESGVKAVSIDELPHFAAALGTSVAYLMGIENDRSRPLEGAASDALRACRDSNPKPSDLYPATVRARQRWGLDLVASVEPIEVLAQVIPFPAHSERSA
ncbi:MAG TPA: helix-turn-helix transcriptional regulator [Nocardioides sp.]|nr:helix-turn-helix transcriptional regulator [Nocardioides sp.]